MREIKQVPDWLKASAPAALLPLEGGRALRLLTEAEEMAARREAMELAVNEMELPLCSNACLVARALVCEDERVYADGRAVMDGLSGEEIEALARRWAEFRREHGVGLGLGAERLERLKASLAAQPRQRLKWRVLKAFGALPTEKRVREMTEEDYLWCAVQLLLDEEEAEAALCPSCRAKLGEAWCPVCGQETGPVIREENTGFDWARYARLKEGGLA